MSRFGVLKFAVIGVLTFVVVQLFAGLPLANGVADAPPGTITFTGSTRLSTAHGVFEKWRITKAELDPVDPQESVVELEVDIASLNTKSNMRDGHLRGEEFFFVDENPTASVKVYAFQRDPKNKKRYTATMDINLRGVEKTMPLAFEVTNESPFTVQGTCELDRTDFGIGKKYNGWNPMSVKTKIVIEFSATIPKPNGGEE